MAVEIVWSDEAKGDLNAILDFIAEGSPTAAANYVAGIVETCGKLGDFPDSGRRYDENFRCVVFRNHLVLYEHDPARQRILIVTVVDGRRDLASLFNAGT